MHNNTIKMFIEFVKKKNCFRNGWNIKKKVRVKFSQCMGHCNGLEN